METERSERIEELFCEALERSEDERAAFLEQACGGDTVLLGEVAALLSEHVRAEGFMESPEGGRRIGPYRLLRILGEGETSTVHLAVRADPHYRKLVAVKLVKRGMDTDSILRRFHQERQILAELDHPNIATLLDGGSTDDGLPYFVMEHVLGEPIDRYCDAHELSINERIELFRTVCSAVQHAHQSLVVHRDLKPGNILITPRGEPKLLDFGIAKLLDPEMETERTATMARLMTPRYASPEQVLGQPVTTATDVYSLGVLLYELLSGRRPHSFSDSTITEIERVVCHQQPEPPSVTVRRGGDPTPLEAAAGGRERLARRLAGDLDTIVMTALHKQPRRRYRSVQELSEDLRRHLHRLPIAARRDSLGYRAGKFIRRNAIGIAAAAAVVASLIAGLAVTTWQARIARQAQARAEAQQLRAEQVSGFLVEMFQVSDPEQENAGDLTAREMLDRGADGITRELADQPEVQATLMTTIGSVYRNLGMYDSAEPLLRRSLELRRQTLGSDHREVGESLNDLASALAFRGRLEEAERLYREALAVMIAVSGEGHQDVASVLNNLGSVVRDRGDYAEAERLHRRALAIHREHLGDDDPMVAIGINNLAAALQRQGKYEEAEPLRRELVDLVRQAFGDEHPHVASSLNNLAVLLAKIRRYEEAEAIYREALALNRAARGDEHPNVAGNLGNLGAVLQKQGKYHEAEQAHREALRLFRKAFGDDHPHTATCLNNLGSALTALDRAEEAERLHRDALAIQSRLLGDDHPNAGTTLAHLATIRSKRGDLADAEALYRRALEIQRQALPPEHPDLAANLLGLGTALLEQGEAADAEPLLREAFEIRLAAFGEADRRTAIAKSAVGGCLAALDRFEEAEPLLVDSHAAILAAGDPADEESRRATDRLITLYEAWQRPDRAAEYRAMNRGSDPTAE